MKIKSVMIDETEYWSEEIQKAAGKVYQYYIFNPAEVTYCCEITPSYTLIPVYFETENRIDEDTFHEMVCANLPSPDFYMHCREVDKIAKEVPQEFDDMDEASEYYFGNHNL